MDTMNIIVETEMKMIRSELKLSGGNWIEMVSDSIITLEDGTEIYRNSVIIHFPLYFSWSNAYLVKTQEEVDEVMETMWDILDKYKILKVAVKRIDYPFTYIGAMPDMFTHYERFFQVIAREIGTDKDYCSITAIKNLEDKVFGTFEISDRKMSKNFRTKVTVYYQELKLIRKRLDDLFKEKGYRAKMKSESKSVQYNRILEIKKQLNREFPKLDRRVRLEVSFKECNFQFLKKERKEKLLDYKIKQSLDLREIKEEAAREISKIFELCDESLKREVDEIYEVLCKNDKGANLMQEKIIPKLYISGILNSLRTGYRALKKFYGENASEKTLESARKKLREILIELEYKPCESKTGELEKREKEILKSYYLDPLVIRVKMLEQIAKEVKL